MLDVTVQGTGRVAGRIDPDEIDRILAGGATLPAPFYTDPDLALLEDELIFRPSWQIVGIEPELRNSGDYLTTVIAGTGFSVPVLILRDEELNLRAYVNVRRRQGLGLEPLPLESWQGFIFVSIAPKTGLKEALGELPAVLEEEGYAFPFAAGNADDSFEYKRVVVESPCASNWKVLLENTVECYHCPTTHTHSFSALYKVDPEHYEHREFDRGAYHTTWYQDEFASRLGLGDRAEPDYRFNWLWPNMFMGGGRRARLRSGWSRLVPAGVHNCIHVSTRFAMPGAEANSLSAEVEEEYVEALRLTGQEDREVSARVQRGLRSGMYTYGYTLQESERNMRHVYKMVWDALSPAFRA